MDLGLSGRGALVVGATGGIGSAVAEMLAEERVGRLALGVRDRAAGERLAERLAGSGPAVGVFDCDLSDPAAPRRCVEAARTELGTIDILVSAAGEPVRGGLFEVDEDAIVASIQSKLLGAARLMRAAVPPMTERGWGRVVLIAGLNGRKPVPGGVAGGVVNAGLANLATAVAKDVAADGVTVNVVDPHFTRTGRWDALVDSTRQARGMDAAEAEQFLLSGVPSGRPIPPAEVAALVGLLVSDRCASVTGSALAVDGGAAPGIY